MKKTEKYSLLLSSISIYRNVVLDDVILNLNKLLKATKESKQEFVSRWSTFYYLISKVGYQDKFNEYIKNTILYDENLFTLEATRGETKELPESIKNTVENELQIFINVGNITWEEIFNDYEYREDIEEIKAFLPKWNNNCKEITVSDLVDNILKFNRNKGYGEYAKYRAFIWREKNIVPVEYPDKVELTDFKEYEYQRNLVIENTVTFINGKSANNCLLYGDKGTGKSSTVKAILNKYYKDGLRIIEMPKENIGDFPILVDKIANIPMKFIIFIDDLSFQKQDDKYASLKAVLEGGIVGKPDNTLIYATSNRRHLIRENFSDRQGDELHINDTIQESLSLADRFGLAINYSLPNKKQYVSIVKSLAGKKGIEKEEKELIELAEKWALQKGGRSPRIAKQFINTLNEK